MIIGNKQYYLTKERYRDLLWIIGTSSKPLTTYQIKEKLEEKKEFDKTSSPYVYEMIKNLHIGFIDSHFEYLFDWNKIPTDKYNRKRLLDYLKDSLKIDLDNYDDIKIFKNSNNILQIEIDSDKKIIMKKDSLHFVHLNFLDKNIQEKSFSFLIKNKNQICIPNLIGNQLDSFIDLSFNKTILFLDKELKPKYQKLVSQKREIYKKLSESQPAKKELNREIEKIFMNNRLYVYSLNIRGLVLYILAEIENESKNNSETHKDKKRKVNHNSQISKVIENLAQHYSRKFPFLYKYLEIRKIIRKIDTPNKFQSNYEIKVLRKIAVELKHLIYFDERYSNSELDSNNNNFISYWITKRYFSEISHYFVYLSMRLPDDEKNESNNLFRNYQTRMIMLMKEYLEKEETALRYVV